MSGLFKDSYAGQSSFEELRRFIKQGSDFCKDLSAILQERSEAEAQYAKSLSKLSGKLVKASKEAIGSVSHAWQLVGAEMEAESEIHRALSLALSEEVSKPLRTLLESHHRTRKQVEAVVEKAGKSLAEWRTAEGKTKKHSFLCARENERLQDASLLVEARLGRASRASSASSTGLEKSPLGSANTNGSINHHNNQHHLSEKELAKLESKRRKAEEAVRKADVEYYTFSIRAERARLEWETAVNKGSQCFQSLEEERLQNLKELATRYLSHIQEVGPKRVQSSDRLTEPILRGCDVSRDMGAVVAIRGSGQPIPEQLLPDFYSEHITLAMNRERRRQNLVKLLQLIRSDVERERRGKQGVENLARALQQTPTFGSQDSQQNVTEKLHHMCSMLTYLEAARYKVQGALAELDGRQRAPHPLAPHITVTRDRQGLQQSVLKVPPWVWQQGGTPLEQLSAGDSPDWTDRGKADGNSVQPDSDFDEFSSQGSDKEYQSSIAYPVISENSDTAAPSVGKCRALYDYAPNLYDELKLRPGDVINIHDKQADGWWLGELNGTIGIFPATYVEEIK
ncbi:nostrin [Hetaerina americana]|uniref:nostrin n=1 Tax=Hetaerina americana TaxID=62018 RepID=UPI003A7F1D4C